MELAQPAQKPLRRRGQLRGAAILPEAPPYLPVIPRSTNFPCYPGKHQRAGHSSNLPPPPAVFPTADSSLALGMTAGEAVMSKCFPLSCRSAPPAVIPRSGATRDLLEFATPSRRIPNCGFLACARNDSGRGCHVEVFPAVMPKRSPRCHAEALPLSSRGAERRGISLSLPPLPAVFPTADSSLALGMTAGEAVMSKCFPLSCRSAHPAVMPKRSPRCHPEERSDEGSP
jgi:hypothetical protein